MFETITTDRLLVRRLERGDADAVFAYRSDPDVSRYQNWEPASAGEISDFMEGMPGTWVDAPGKWFQLGIVLRESGVLIGDCGIRVASPERTQAEVGITIAPPFQRRGFASEALSAVLDFLFGALGMHRVYGSVDPRNEASRALLGGIGMREEAHLVESLWFKGGWVDDVIYAILDREWRRSGDA